jgi:hypothetical protein
VQVVQSDGTIKYEPDPANDSVAELGGGTGILGILGIMVGIIAVIIVIVIVVGMPGDRRY